MAASLYTRLSCRLYGGGALAADKFILDAEPAGV